MDKILVKFNLEYTGVFEYFDSQMKMGNILSTELYKTFDFRNGHFYTLLPNNANMEAIYDFEGGGILIQNPKYNQFDDTGKKSGSYTWIPTLKTEIAQYISTKMKKNKNNFCFFEDVERLQEDPDS